MMHKAWCSIEEVPYCFPRPSIKFQGHKGQKIDDLDQIWARLLGRSQLSNPSDLPCLFSIYIITTNFSICQKVHNKNTCIMIQLFYFKLQNIHYLWQNEYKIELVRAIIHQPFKPGSPNLDQRCKRPWLRSLLFCGVIDGDLQGQIGLESQNLPHFWLVSLSGR